jgi:hypothetical protein
MADENPPDDPQKWCFAWFEAPLATSANQRAGLLKTAKWPSGAVIRIAFLDGTPQQISLVKRHSVRWITNLANLNFGWVNDLRQSDVRITFQFNGSWSVIGTTCKNVEKTKATMNFGWLTPKVTDEEARRVILHEFGHALGLIHEHQRLDPVAWNKPAVIADLSGPPNKWNAKTIEQNMFDVFPTQKIGGTSLAGCGKRFLKVASDIAIVSCDMSTGANITD